VGLQPIVAAPGICLSASHYAVGKDFAYVGEGNTFRQGTGRWVAGTNVEFIAGFPQKIAGWVQASSQQTVDIPRAVCPWRDNNGDARTGIGTASHLYYLLGSTLTDITPWRTISSGSLTNPFTTVADSDVVAVADSSQTLNNGDWVYLSGASPVGGITINGYYPVSGETGTGYDITVPAPASSSSTGGGATAFGYPRVTLTNPFATVSGLPTVTVTHNGNGSSVGNYVDYSGGSAVGGLTLNGEFEVQTIVDANHYTITASSPATSTVTAGGGSVSVTYDIQVEQTTNASGIGWGDGAYGVGAYGFGLTATTILTNGWTLAAYGNQLLAAPIGGTIYVYNPVFGGRAYPLLNAPTSLIAMFVTPERFVVALGTYGNLMQLSWADQSDYTDWTTTATNTANTGRTLVGGSYFVGGIGIRDGVSLIFTDRCVFNMTYTGSNEVYTTQQTGDNCGLVDPTAVCVEGGIAYWMSDQDFWLWNGAVQPLPSDDIRASVFQNINRQFLSKCTTVLNRTKRQVRFWYPSATAMENDGGMIYQYDQQCFAPLGFGRSAGFDAELLSTPISTDINGFIYYDETGTDANGAALPMNLGLGLTDLANGDRDTDIWGFIPDFPTLVGTIDLTIQTVYFSPYSSETDGPYPIVQSGNRQDLRSAGKAFSIALASNEIGATFRLGVPRLEITPAGTRR